MVFLDGGVFLDEKMTDIAQLRKDAGFRTQRDAAEATGRALPTIGKYEMDKGGLEPPKWLLLLYAALAALPEKERREILEKAKLA